MTESGLNITMPYLDKAVVEEKPDEGRAHPTLEEDGLEHGGPHDELQRRAARRVE